MPITLRNSIKGFINVKSNDNKLFAFCQIRHLNPLKTQPERIAKSDKNMINGLDYKGIKFHVSKKHCCNIYMHIVMKINWFILLMDKIKNLKSI